jgi:hypothetical protein
MTAADRQSSGLSQKRNRCCCPSSSICPVPLAQGLRAGCRVVRPMKPAATSTNISPVYLRVSRPTQLSIMLVPNLTVMRFRCSNSSCVQAKRRTGAGPPCESRSLSPRHQKWRLNPHQQRECFSESCEDHTGQLSFEKNANRWHLKGVKEDVNISNGCGGFILSQAYNSWP